MPSSHTRTASLDVEQSSTSALHTLVANLRNHEANTEMIEARETNSDAELLRELQSRRINIAIVIRKGCSRQLLFFSYPT